MPPAPRPADPIDAVLALDLGGRGIASFFSPGGAMAAARALAGGEHFLIVTGFSVPPGVAETDGPPGAAVLGRALRLLGAQVRYVTDRLPAPILAAALEALEERAEVEVYPELPGAARLILERCDGNKREACRVLGISYHTLQAYVRIQPPVDESEVIADAPDAAHLGAGATECSESVEAEA